MPGPGSIKSVLYFESDTSASSHFEQLMGSAGVKTFICSKASEAVSSALDCEPDAFFVSTVVDGRLGFPIARSLRAHPALYRAPVAICSHESDGRSKHQALSQYADCYLAKPITAADLGVCMTQLERMSTDLSQSCPVTNLPSIAHFVRYVDHRLLRGEVFALLSVRVSAQKSEDHAKMRLAVQDSVRTLATIAQNLIVSHGFYEVKMAHRGGWFMIMLRPGDESRFAGSLQRRLAALAQPQVCAFEIAALDSRLREFGTCRDLVHCMSCASPPHVFKAVVGATG
jgi:DNA-binding response OmpR family regulator